MTQIQFHETRAGAEFYRRTMPELVKQLTRIADALEGRAGETSAESPSGAAQPGSPEGPANPGANKQP